MALFQRDGIEIISGALEGMRKSIADLKVGISACDQQQAANIKAMEALSERNAGLSAKAAGARALIGQIDSIVPVPVD